MRRTQGEPSRAAEVATPTIEERMAWVDGALPADAAARVEAALDADPALRAELERMREAGGRIADEARSVAARAEAFDVAASVMRRIERERAPEARRGRGAWVMAAVSVSALVLAVSGPRVRSEAGAPVEGAPASFSSFVASTPTTPSVRSAPSASIESVDFGEHSGAVFLVSDDDGAVVPVVWMTHDDPGASP